MEDKGLVPRRLRNVTRAERLKAYTKLDAETGCILWTGWTSHNGYGRMWLGDHQSTGAHRVAYELAKGLIPDGYEIDHLCRTPACCNPDHLEAVTRLENIARGNAPHMINSRKTHCKRGHPLEGDNLRLIFYKNKKMRACVECTRLLGRRHSLNRPPKPRKGHPPKVFSGCFDGKTQMIVAATSQPDAARASKVSMYAIKTYGHVTGNETEIGVAMSKPGTVFSAATGTLDFIEGSS